MTSTLIVHVREFPRDEDGNPTVTTESLMSGIATLMSDVHVSDYVTVAREDEDE
jgi:hypothetical protein